MNLTQTDSADVERALASMSRDLLADLVIDLVRRGAGEDIDGAELLAALASAAEPIRVVRKSIAAPERTYYLATIRPVKGGRVGPPRVVEVSMNGCILRNASDAAHADKGLR